MEPGTTVRLMREMDLAGADMLRRTVGWNQTMEDWRQMLHLEPEGCFVAEMNGEIAGTVTTTCYGSTLAWIGMMLVHPQYRRQGLGTRLMRRALDYLKRKGVRCVKLDATPEGRPLYEKLGFQFESELTRWQRAPQIETGGVGSPGKGTRGMQEKDWLAIAEIDAAAFGVARSHLLRNFAKRSRQILVWPREGAVGGWGLLRSGANADYLGPVACRSMEGGIALASDLLSAANQRPVFWDVPEANESAKTTAKRLGFRPLRPLMRMRKGAECVASNPGVLFAIADPAVG
jgi:predicted N-acetyltransferase YhbS